MLPGIRFLLAAILLSISVVVFGLGAAALLRAAHEEFASNPAWRVTPETKFAQANDTPTLALLRVEMPQPAEKPADTPASTAPQAGATARAAAPAEQVAVAHPAPEAAPTADATKADAPPAAQASDTTPALASKDAAPASDQQARTDAPQEQKVAAIDAGSEAPKVT